MVAAVNDAVFSRDLEGRITSWNPAAERLFHHSTEEVLGSSYFPRFQAGSQDILRTELESIERGRAIHGFQAQCRTKEGALINVILSAIPMTNAHGKSLGTRFIASRVNYPLDSSMVAGEMRSCVRLRAIINYSADPIVLVTSNAETIYCSDATGRLLGRTPQETWGCSIYTYIHQEDQPEVRSVLLNALANPGKQFKVRTRLRHRNGNWLTVEAVFHNLLDVPSVQGVLINFRDITEALVAEEAARKSNERFARAFRRNPLALSISTRDEGRYIDVNDAYLQMFGLTRDAVIGYTSTFLNLWVDPKDRTNLIEQLDEGGPSTFLETRMRASNGEIRDVQIHSELIEMDGLPCVLSITQDVTDAKRMELQFLRTQRMEAVGRLAGGLAHDFNNVLGAIIGHSEIAEEQLAPGHPIVRNISQIKKAADRAASLIRQLLAFSRQQLLYPRVLDLNGIVRGLCDMLRPMLGTDVFLEFRPAPSLGSVRADPGQMEQVVMNLVLNARDAMPNGGKLILETAEVELDSNYAAVHPPVIPGRYVMLSVTDTGTGIPAEILPHIFEPFFTTKHPGKGNGLGLSTAYGIVKQSTGYIWVYSEPGQGTTFKIYFPKVLEAPTFTVETSSPSVVSLAAKPTETILVVEDDRTLRDLVASLLSAAGYAVLEAETPQAALQLVDRHPTEIDLLLTDVVLPAMNGGELANLLRAKRPTLKLLFMSGYSPELISSQGAVQPGVSIVEKPFTRSELLHRVRDALQSSPLRNS